MAHQWHPGGAGEVTAGSTGCRWSGSAGASSRPGWAIPAISQGGVLGPGDPGRKAVSRALSLEVGCDTSSPGGPPARYDAAGPAMSDLEGVSEENRPDRPRRRRHGVQVFGQWVIIAGILAAVVGLVAQLLVAARASRVWNLFGDPRLVRVDRMPAADFGILILGVASGVVLVLFGVLTLAVRRRRPQ